MKTLSEAIDALTALYEFGALQAATSPAEFLLRVRDELAALRAALAAEKERGDRLAEEIRTTLLADEERRKLTGDALAAEAERDAAHRGWDAAVEREKAAQAQLAAVEGELARERTKITDMEGVADAYNRACDERDALAKWKQGAIRDLAEARECAARVERERDAARVDLHNCHGLNGILHAEAAKLREDIAEQESQLAAVREIPDLLTAPKHYMWRRDHGLQAPELESRLAEVAEILRRALSAPDGGEGA